MTAPNHPTFISLATHFTHFSEVGFPRGIPQPASAWTELLKGVTNREAAVVTQAYAYLQGKPVDEIALQTPAKLGLAFAGFVAKSPEDKAYLKKLVDYKSMIEHIAELTLECVNEFGNPYQNHSES